MIPITDLMENDHQECIKMGVKKGCVNCSCYSNELGCLIEYHYNDNYNDIKNVIQEKIEKLKEEPSELHNFKRQMIKDFEWVISLF